MSINEFLTQYPQLFYLLLIEVFLTGIIAFLLISINNIKTWLIKFLKEYHSVKPSEFAHKSIAYIIDSDTSKQIRNPIYLEKITSYKTKRLWLILILGVQALITIILYMMLQHVFA